ncbi:hypothetical protein [uncultured Shewanella sp.]|uniref:hypothetical protein n=1 Tax=uncultured Shewanella sp. TaxID=173975 RepID=UPI002609D3FB|nr:hypothetical protein [uncultured Shewanella sp.]
MKLTLSATLLAISLVPQTSLAETTQGTTVNEGIEVITVTYRSPFDYALYQYTTEILSNFRSQIETDIYTQARASSQQMAKSHLQMTAWVTPYSTDIIDSQESNSE